MTQTLAGPAGSISGYVRDQAGLPIADAKVVAVGGPDSQPPMVAVTGADGSFTLRCLGSGSYTVWASVEGYEIAEQQGILVQLGQTSQGVTLILGPGQSSTLTILGSVRISGAGLGGVLLTFSGLGTTTTDSQGNYTYTVPMGWSGTVTASKAGDMFSPSSRSYTSITVDQTGQDFLASSLSPLQDAMDCTVQIQTGGDADWFRTTSVAYDGLDSAQSSDIDDNQETWIQATVQVNSVPLTVTFWWKVSSEQNYDWLEFHIDGTRKDRISGNIDWQQKTYSITTTGSHTLRWRYVKDSSVSSGSDCAWVDCLTLTSSP